MTGGGSPYPFVHGVESQDVRKVLWSHAGVFQEPAFEMSPGPTHFTRQCLDADPTVVLFQTTNGVFERQIPSIVWSKPLAKPHLETRDTIFLGREVHELVLEPSGRSVEDLFAVKCAVGDSAVRWAKKAVSRLGPDDDPDRIDPIGKRQAPGWVRMLDRMSLDAGCRRALSPIWHRIAPANGKISLTSPSGTMSRRGSAGVDGPLSCA